MMVVGKEDLGLSLSLACTSTNTATATKTDTTTNNNASVVVGGHGANKNHHNLGFMMMMNRNNHHINNNNNSHHGQMMNNNNINNNNHSNASTPLQLNLMNPSLNSSNSTPHNTTHTSFLQKLQRNQSTDSFPNSDRNSDTCRLFLRGIDVNRPAGAGGSGGGDEEDPGVSSPNSTVSTISGKRSLSERDSAGAGDDLDGERASSRGLSDDEDGGENSRKKLRLTKDQSAILEESFKEHNTLNPKQKQALAKRLGLRPRQVEVWFQNRRARTKLKQTEVDCEFLKRCCEQLTEENRRLQKEVQELRTLKLSPQFYMQMTPPTTLTMCPSCERVAAPPGSAQPKLNPGPDSRAAHRPMGANPWAVPNSVPIRSFDGLHPRA